MVFEFFAQKEELFILNTYEQTYGVVAGNGIEKIPLNSTYQ